MGLCLAGPLLAASPRAAAAAYAPLPIGRTVLRYGDLGPAVRVLQADLWQFGYNPGPVDGIFGPRTLAALRAFQRRRDIVVSGRLDPATFQQVLVALGYRAPAPRTKDADDRIPPASAPASHTPRDGGHGGPAPSPGASGDNHGQTSASRSQTSASSPGVHGGSGPAQISHNQQLVGGPAQSAERQASLAAASQRGGQRTSPPTAGSPPAASHSEILAYWAVWGSNATELGDLGQHARDITWLSPYWYTLGGNGTLSSRESDHAQVLSAAHAVQVPVLALINQGSGVTSLLSSAAGRTMATQSVVALLRTNPGLSGVVIDFELLPPSARNDLTAFVQELRATLPPKSTIGVAVMPKSSSPGPSYAQVFDYAALGKAADFIQLMTYDRHSNSSAPGPISPNNWVAQVARYAATVIPPQKILLGVPGYGYDWTSGGSTTSIDTTQALAIASAHGVTPTYDATSGEDHFTYLDSAGRLHTVWFESAAGVATKHTLSEQMGLGGLALWTIGGEQPTFWPSAEGQG